MKGIQEISGENIVAILQVGLSGLAFLLMLLCFYLLHREQGRQGTPRQAIIRAIDRYRQTCLIFAVVIGIFGLLDIAAKRYFGPSSAVSEACADAVQRAQFLASGGQQDASTLRALIQNGLGACRPADQAFRGDRESSSLAAAP